MQLAAHKTHMSALLAAIASYDTSFTPSHLYLRTTYPHLPPRPAPDAVPPEGARRRRAAGRGQLGGMLAVEALTPVKSRKRVRDDDDSQLAPRRERESASTNTHRRGGTSATKTRRCGPSIDLLTLFFFHDTLAEHNTGSNHNLSLMYRRTYNLIAWCPPQLILSFLLLLIPLGNPLLMAHVR